MTVTYTAEVATCKKFGCFLRLLLRWRGSIYKLVWMDLLAFILVYYTFGLVYRLALNKQQQLVFENVVHYFESYSSLIPLSFVLGFFVSIVMTRWWEQYCLIPWPDPIAVFVSAHIHGQDDRARLMRRTIMRYVCLSQAIVFTLISPKVKKRFPTYQSFVDAGLMLENERFVFDTMDESFPKIPKYWMPIVWAASIVTRARKEGRTRDDFAVKTIVDELNKFRGMLGTLLIYDMIPVPLVYTQVVTVAVYTFFLGCVLGMQWTQASDKSRSGIPSVEFYIPVFTILQFFFYMGWLKVAESLINPFGEDDDDFEVSWMIDRNLQVSYLIVDEMHQEHPDLVKDQYWDEVFPSELPYDGDVKREEIPEPSTAKIGEKHAPMSNVVVDQRRSAPADQLARHVLVPQEDEDQDMRRRSLGSMSAPHSSRYSTAFESIPSRSTIGSQSILEGPITPPPTVSFDLEQKSTESKQRIDESQQQQQQQQQQGQEQEQQQQQQPPEQQEQPQQEQDQQPEQQQQEEQQPEQAPQQPTEQQTRLQKLDGLYEPVTDSDESIETAKGKRPTLPAPDTDVDEKDDFQRLKEERERERLERQRLRFVQTMEDVTNIAARPTRSPELTSELYNIEEEEEEEEQEMEENQK